MGTPKEFARLLSEHLNWQPAWIPVTNTFEVGDYGLISNGVFTKMGNIAEYGADVEEADGPPSSMNLKSNGVRLVRFVGGVEVPEFPAGEAQASLKFEFENKFSLFASAKTITSREMQNINIVARWLRKNPEWERRFWIVSTAYTGQNCTFLSTVADKTDLEFSGSASALEGIAVGDISASADFKLSLSANAGVKTVGKSGVIGLRLFKLRWLTGGINTLETDLAADADGADVEIDFSDDEGVSLEDDL